MSIADQLPLVAGLLAGGVGPAVLARGAAGFTVAVEDEHVALVTSFGRLVAKLDRPGLHVLPLLPLPWVKVRQVSVARDFRVFRDVHANDARGTTVIADLWVELRITDPERAVFAVEDWEKATLSVVVHAAMSLLGARDFQRILDDRRELGEELAREVSAETERWGIRIERAFVRNVALLPEVSRQVLGKVAARLERARAEVEEQGRLDAARLEAETERRVAGLVADARAQYAIAVGRGLAALAARPRVLAAYEELHALAQIRGARTVAFRGFAPGEVRKIEALMLPTPDGPAVRAPAGPGGAPG